MTRHALNATHTTPYVLNRTIGSNTKLASAVVTPPKKVTVFIECQSMCFARFDCDERGVAVKRLVNP